jgi:hypothetical protein
MTGFSGDSKVEFDNAESVIEHNAIKMSPDLRR